MTTQIVLKKLEDTKRQIKMEDEIKLEIKKFVRDEIGTYKGELNAHKVELKKEIIKEVGTYFRKEITKFVYDIGREFLMQELKTIDIPEEMTLRFNKLLTEHMKPIIEEAYKYVNTKHRKAHLKYLQNLSNLKTSTIQGIRQIEETLTITEAPEIADSILNDFPEYKKAIEQTKKIEVK